MEIRSCSVGSPGWSFPFAVVTHGDPVVSCCRSFLFAVSHSWRSGRALLPVLPICCQSLMEIRLRPVAGPSSLPSVTHGDPVVSCCRSFPVAVSHSRRSDRVLWLVLAGPSLFRHSLMEIRSCPVGGPGRSFPVAISHSWRSGRVLLLVLAGPSLLPSVTHGDPVVSCC